MIIKWRNKHSGETGYVAAIDKQHGHMISTAELQSAYDYANKGLATIAVNALYEIGEAENNDFELV